MLPVFVDTDSNNEEVLDASAYRTIASVLRAMRDHDDEPGEILDGLRRGLGARTQPRLPTDKVVVDVPATLKKDFIDAIHAQVIRLTTSSWEEGFEALTTYVQAEGSARVPKRYCTAAGYRLGAWVANQRSRQDSLSADRRERLEGVRGWGWAWDENAAAWEEGFEALTTYVQAEGSARVPKSYCTAAGYRLGEWVSGQRSKKDGRLSEDRRQRLAAVEGWVWDAPDAAWEDGFEALTAYVQAEGSARVPKSYCTAAGYRLGAWVGKRRSQQDSLSADRRERLEGVRGWVWDPFTADWEDGFEALTAYVQAEGHARVPYPYRTAAGYRLGQWVGKRRSQQDSLSADRRERLEGVRGWVWDPFTADWEDGFEALTAYVQAEGSARVPQSYRTAAGYRLGTWVRVQRRQQDSMSADRRQRLEAVDGWVWDAQDYDAAWDKGFEHLTTYVQAEGSARVPQSYCTAAGYRLGLWVAKRRSQQDFAVRGSAPAVGGCGRLGVGHARCGLGQGLRTSHHLRAGRRIRQGAEELLHRGGLSAGDVGQFSAQSAGLAVRGASPAVGGCGRLGVGPVRRGLGEGVGAAHRPRAGRRIRQGAAKLSHRGGLSAGAVGQCPAQQEGQPVRRSARAAKSS